MIWESITLNELNTLIDSGAAEFTASQLHFWNTVKLIPEKWDDLYLGAIESFWVVAIFGKKVIWYNDIEEGFNISDYMTYGKIESGNFGAEQDELNWCIYKILE
jgi:hypothetical protein